MSATAMNGLRDTQNDRRQRPAVLLPALVAAVMLAAPAGAPAAEECSIATNGPAAYERVMQRVREKLPKIEQFDFEPYENVQISLEAGCEIVLHGRFTFKLQRNQESRVYDARVTPKAGAPGGIKILKLELSRN